MDSVEQIRMTITEESLSTKFQNIIVENGDKVIIRSSVKTMGDVNEWVKELGIRTNTKWNCRSSCPLGEKFVCWKKFDCHHSSSNKVPAAENKKGNSKNTGCQASLTIKIKLDTVSTRKKDDFICRGLAGVITITPFHKHSLKSAEILRFLPAEDLRVQFEEYFNEGMGTTESIKYHREILERNPAFQPSDLVNSRINPTKRTIAHWHDQWRLHLETRNGHGMLKEIPTVKSSIMEIASSTTEPFTTSLSSEHDIQPETNSSRIEHLEMLIEAFGDTIKKFNPSRPAVEKALMRLRKISSKRQCAAMLRTLGSNVSLKKSSGATRVQPSLISRTVGVTEETKQLSCGHPSGDLSWIKKET